LKGIKKGKRNEMSDTKSPYKLDRWHKLNAEERSWILLRAYKGGLITQA
jgi:hypothetical protein